jgi:hypothetical protein
LKGFGSGPAPASCVYDASAYRGIEFRARGVEVRVSIEMDLDMPESNTFGAPGACPSPVLEDCYNRHGFELKLTKNWDFYQLLWDDLAQRDYGAWHPDFDPSRLLGVYFEVIPDPVSNSIPGYQIDVDDVVFLP